MIARHAAQFLFVLALLSATSAHAQSEQLPATAPANISAQLWQRMQQIDHAAAAITDLSADFQQRKFTPLLKQPMLSTGAVYAAGPVMLWKTQGPTPTVMRTDTTTVTLYYPLQKTAEIYPLAGQLAQLAASPVPRLSELLKNFTFAPANLTDWKDFPPSTPTTDLQAFTLTPATADLRQHVDSVNVLIDAPHGFIVGFRLTDTDNETTELRFTNIKINTHFPKTKLELNLPSDTKIVHPLENLPPQP